MTTRNTLFKKALAILVAFTVFMTAVPLTVLGADSANYTTLADEASSNEYTHMLGTANDGNRYSGRVWTDKSVYTDATVTLDKDTDGNDITIQNDDDFMVVYSALGSSTSLTTETAAATNLDVVFVLDTSRSMENGRLSRVVTAANTLLEGLSNGNNRIAVVDYNGSASTIAGLSAYTKLSLSLSGGVVTARDNGTRVGANDGHGSGTYTQSGVDLGFEVLENATNKTGRSPVLIVLSDGLANYATKGSWYNPGTSKNSNSVSGSGTAGIILSTLLNGAFKKSSVEKLYGRTAYVYGISVEITSDRDSSAVIMDPANNFKSNSSSSDGRTAYTWFQNWVSSSSTVTGSMGFNSSWTFEQVPSGTTYNPSGVTKQDVVNNIAYVDTHFEANDTEALEQAFGQILTELKTPAFIPTVDTTTTGTGTTDTPLTYVDFIGEYMEIKALKAVTLFGKTYTIGAGTAAAPTYTTNGKLTRTTVTTYPVGAGTAAVKHPTMGSIFNISDNIWLTITEEVTGAYNAAGTFVPDSVPVQTLRVYIKSTALPVILDAVQTDVDGNVTFTETAAVPVRVYYTVGVADAVCKADGNVDLSKVDDAYITANTDAATGKVQFYASRYGVMNAADAQGVVANGDSHISFTPSAENRYYYHQNSYAIFFDVKDAQGNAIVPEANEYGIEYKTAMDGYQYNYLDAADIFEWQGGQLVQKIVDDDHPLYTYIEFYHVDQTTGKGKLTYLLAFATWGELKNDLTAVKLTGETLNGQALHEYIADDKTVFTVDDLREYIEDNNITDLTTIRARMAVGTQRVYRLNHMFETKATNATGTAVNAYAPTFNEDPAHVGGIVVWLGNNGVLSVEPEALSIVITKTVAGDEAVTDDFTFTVHSDANHTENVTLYYYDNAGQLAKSEPATFTGGLLTVSIGDGEKVVITGLTKDVEYTVTETAHAGYNLTSVNGNTNATSVTLTAAAGEAATAAFVNTAKEYGNLVVSKEVQHTFGANYVVPDSLGRFVIRVHLALNGQNVANQTFNAAYSDSRGNTTVTTDADGNFEVELAHNERIEVFGLEAGTVANGTELYKDGSTYYTYVQAGGKWYAGFTAPRYYDDDGSENGQVDILADTTVAGIVFNTYAPTYTELAVDIDLSGTKTVENDPGTLSDKFTFELQQWDGTDWVPIDTATAKSGQAIAFTGDVFKYTAIGSYSYQVVEIAGNNGGITYDPTKHTFTVTIADADMDGKLEVASVVSDHTNQDFNKNGDTFSNDHIDFNNRYQSGKALAELNVQKELINLSGSPLVDLEGYEFQLYLGGALVTTSHTDALGKAQLVWEIDDVVGTYTYVLKEVNAGKPGMTYAGEITIDVEIVDNGDGTKSVSRVHPYSATVNGDGEIVVTNTYAPTAAVVAPNISKTLTGRDMTADEFTFQLKQVIIGQESYVKTVVGSTETVLTANGITVKNPAADDGVKATILFPSLKFEKVGNYYFTIDELGTDKEGVTYDKNVYHVHVQVTDKDGILTPTATIYEQLGTENTVHFKNTYAAKPVTYAPTAKKTLNGRDLKAGEFVFNLVGNGQTYTKANTAAGAISFPTLTFAEAGTYEYTLTEVKNGNANVGQPGYNGVSYDSNVFTYTIVVKDDLAGQLYLDSVVIRDAGGYPVTGQPEFRNEYEASAMYSLTGMKYLDGGEVAYNDYNFAMYAADAAGNKTGNQPLDTQFNEADGSFEFQFHYQLDLRNGKNDLGTHYYVVEEVDGGAYKAPDGAKKGIKYDARQYLVAVTVADNGDGTLSVTDTKTRMDNQAAYESLIFVNVAHDIASKDVYLLTDPTISIDGRSVSVGDVLGYSIEYYNGYDAEATVTIEDTLPEGTTYVDGSADHDGVYADGKVTWELTVPADTAVTVTFQARVTAGGATIANEAKVISGNNTYTSNEVVNYTFEKQVSSDKAVVGETLTYNIVYTNNTGKTVSELIITDTLPHTLAYTDGTANLDGVYDGNKHTVTWTFTNVAPRQTVIVGFDAVVTGGSGNVDNQVVISEDGYEIRTNTASTEILLPHLEIHKAQAVNGGEATDETVKVKAGDKVVYTITVTNTGKIGSGPVTITDKLPEGLIVDAQSGVNMDGMLVDGVVTWNLMDIDVGDTIILTIEATIPEVQENTEWTNVATLVYDKDDDGDEDTEDSNGVTLTEEAPEKPNLPETPEAPQQPEKPQEPQRPQSPQTGDNTNLALWFALFFVSGGVLFVTTKKRIKAE